MSGGAVALIRKLYADAGTGNWDDVAAVMSDAFVIHEPASVPFGGSYHGRDALQRLFGIVMATWIDPAVEIDAMVGDETHVVALLRFTMTSRHSGRRFTQHLTEVSRIEDGKVVEMRVHYFDAAEIAREASGQGAIAA